MGETHEPINSTHYKGCRAIMMRVATMHQFCARHRRVVSQCWQKGQLAVLSWSDAGRSISVGMTGSCSLGWDDKML